MAKVKVFE